MRPAPNTHTSYFGTYINKVSEDNLLEALENNRKNFLEFLAKIPMLKENYAYASGKWTIKQVVNHVIDTERIFAYRALRFARKDPQLVAAFEEDDYADASAAEVYTRSLKSLAEEFDLLRRANIQMFKHISQPNLILVGKMASGPATALALGFCICGHTIHHQNVIQEKYL